MIFWYVLHYPATKAQASLRITCVKRPLKKRQNNDLKDW